MEEKEWREDEQEREKEKRTLGFDARKDELLYQRDTREEKQKGWDEWKENDKRWRKKF